MDCQSCRNARLIVSENGHHLICTLSTKKAGKCIKNSKSYYVHKENEVFIDGHNVTNTIYDGTMDILSYNDGIQESMLNFKRRMDAIESKAHIIRAKTIDRLT